MLHTYETGSPDAPPVVFLHGGGLSSKSWYPVIERLPEFHCLAPDLPGHGRSQDLPFSLTGSAQGVASLIREKCPRHRAHLVGLSLGGAVILTLLRLTPELADHVILTGSSGRLPRWLVGMSMPLFSILKLMKPATLVRNTLRQQGIPDRHYDLLYDDLISSSRIPFLRRMFTELTTLEMPREVSAQLLVCVGEKDPGGSRLYGGLSLKPLRQYPSARGVVMPRGTHAWPLQFPDVFAEMVRAWVTDRPLPSVLRPVTA